MSIRLNQTQFASQVGCSQQNISKLIKKGVIKKEKDKKIDTNKAIQSLRDYGLLDKNNKFKKSRTKKENRSFTKINNTLPFEGDVPYDSYAYLSDEEIEEQERRKEEAREELRSKEELAKHKNIEFDSKLNDEIKYSDAKAHREYYMGKIAELDYQIKLDEYITKEEVKKSFFEIARTIRDALMNYPSKMSLRVVGKTDIKNIENVLMEEIQVILGNLSNE